jgi:hypothetical protein
MKTDTTYNIDAIKQQIYILDADKKKLEKLLKDEIARQEKIEAELKSKNRFGNWTPTKSNIIDVIKMSEEPENLPLFKGLTYTSDISDLAYENTTLVFGDGWKITSEYTHGGGEGDGSEHYTVLKVTQNDINDTFWMVPGYYQSYNGGELELDDIYQVEPYEKTVTDYRKI